MSRFQVSAPGIRPATVEAGNWLAALGLGLDKLGLDADFNRLACEVLPNGTVIAQDVRSGNRFVVRPEVDEAQKPSEVAEERSGRSGSAAFKEASSPESGYSLDMSVPPEDVDTVVPDEEDEEFEAEAYEDERDSVSRATPLGPEVDSEELLPVEVSDGYEVTDEEPIDADSATSSYQQGGSYERDGHYGNVSTYVPEPTDSGQEAVLVEHTDSGQEAVLVEHTDEDVAEIDSRMVELLPLEPLPLEPLPVDALPLDELPPDALPPDLMEPDAGTTEDDDDERLVLELLETIRHARTDILAWQVALTVAMQLVPSEAGSALQRDPSGSVQFVGTEGPGAHVLRGVRLPQGIGIIGFCMDRRASIIVHDPKNDPRFYRDMDDATGFATRAVLCVPVALEQEVFGCLELMNPPIGQSFNRVHIELVEMVAFTLADRLVIGRSPS